MMIESNSTYFVWKIFLLLIHEYFLHFTISRYMCIATLYTFCYSSKILVPITFTGTLFQIRLKINQIWLLHVRLLHLRSFVLTLIYLMPESYKTKYLKVGGRNHILWIIWYNHNLRTGVTRLNWLRQKKNNLHRKRFALMIVRLNYAWPPPWRTLITWFVS